MILPDLLAPDLHLVLCGTAPSRASMAARAYYAGPGNLFWPTLHAVGLTEGRLQPADYAYLLRDGIGLTDLCKTAFGSDAELTADDFDIAGFRAKMERFRPAAVAFDSKNAAKAFFGRARIAYGRQPETLAGAALFVLPSPSGRARSHWDIAHWQEVGAFVRRRRVGAASTAGPDSKAGAPGPI